MRYQLKNKILAQLDWRRTSPAPFTNTKKQTTPYKQLIKHKVKTNGSASLLPFADLLASYFQYHWNINYTVLLSNAVDTFEAKMFINMLSIHRRINRKTPRIPIS